MSGSSGILSNLIVNLVANIDGFQAGMNSAADSLQKAGAKMADLGKAWTQNVTAPILAAGAVIFTVANDFQDKLGEMAAATGMAAEHADEWGEALLRLGPAVGKGPSELIGPLEKIIKAGFGGAEALGILEKAGQASAAGIGSLSGNVETLVTRMKNYMGTTRSVSGIMDQMVAASQVARVNIDDFGASFGKLAPQIRESNIWMAEATSALAGLTQQSGSLGVASKQLQSFMKEINAPSKDMVDALKRVGMTVEDLKKSFAQNGLDRTMQNLGDKMKGAGIGMDAVFKSASAVHVAMQLSDRSATSMTTAFDRVRNSYGSLNQAFETAGGPDKLEKTMALVQVGLVKLGTVVVPLVNKAIDALNGYIERAIKYWDGLSAETKQSMVYLAGILAAVGPLLVVLGTLVGFLGWVVSGFAALLGVLSNLLTILEFLWTLFTYVRVVLLGISGPVGIVIAAIAVLIYYFRDKIPAAIKAAVAAFKSFAASPMKSLEKLWKSMTSGFDRAWKGISKFVSKVTKALPGAFTASVTMIMKAINGLMGSFSKLNFPDIGKALFSGIGKSASVLTDGIYAAIQKAMSLAAPLQAAMFEGIKSAYIALWEWIADAAQAVWTKIKYMLGLGDMGNVTATFNTAAIEGLLQQILDAILALGIRLSEGDAADTDPSSGAGTVSNQAAVATREEAEAFIAQLKALGDAFVSAEISWTGNDVGSYIVDYTLRTDTTAEPEGGCECAPWLEAISATLSAILAAVQAGFQMTQEYLASSLTSSGQLLTTAQATLAVITAGQQPPAEGAAAMPGIDALLAAVNTSFAGLFERIAGMHDQLVTSNQHLAGIAMGISSMQATADPTGGSIIPVDGGIAQAITQTITFQLDSRILAQAVAEHLPDILNLNGA